MLVRILERRSTVIILACLIAARLGASIWSTAGIGWDFANYYQTALRVTNGEMRHLYHLPQSRMANFYQLTGNLHARAETSPELVDDPEVPSGRMGFIGFPAAAFLFAPLGHLPPRWSLFAFKLACGLFLLASAWLLYRRFAEGASSHLGDGTLATFLGLCLLYSPFWVMFAAGGQASALNLLLLVVFMQALSKGKEWTAAMALALGILVKPFFTLMLPILVLTGEWRVVGRIAAVLGGAFGLSVLALGWPLHLEWLAVLSSASGDLAEPWWNNVSMFTLIYAVWSTWTHGSLAPAGEMSGPANAALGFGKLLVLLVFLRLAWMVRSHLAGPGWRREYATCLAVLFALCFSNIVWPHYLAFLFVPLVFGLFPTRRLTPVTTAMIWLIFVSTLAVESRFAQRAALSLLSDMPMLQAVTAGLFGGTTLLMTMALLASHSGFGMIRLRPRGHADGRD